jgi:Membrane domain of glycerophosphoryl diester phosphodiesterase
VSEPEQVELERPRNAGELLGDSLGIYFRNFLLLVGGAAVVVVPIELILLGFGLKQFTADPDASLSSGAQVMDVLVMYAVVAPLVTAIVVGLLRSLGAGQRPRFGATVVSALEAFTPLFITLVIAAAGISIGLIVFIVPGIYLAVRWTFAAQAVLLDKVRGAAALQRSSELTTGHWWRVFGVLLLAGLVAVVVTAVVGLPFELGARSADSGALRLGGLILVRTLTTPFLALMVTLLYFDLRARRGVAAAAV